MSRPFQAQRAVLYFAFSPTEALTARDLDIKLGLPAKAVPTLLRRSCKSGLLAKGQDIDGRVTYRAGPELLKMIEGMKRWL